MKRLFLFNSFFLVLILSSQILAQTGFSPTMASRLMTFDSGGLLNAGTEVLLPVSDSAAFSLNYGMKTLRLLDGIYYQVLSSKKSGSWKIYLRKSQDGINWGGLVKVGDSPADISESRAGIYVWKKNGNVNVGVTYPDNRDGDYQLRFALSTDGGNTFDSSIAISSHSNADYIYNGALEGKGDTLVACWVPDFDTYRNKTFFNFSTDGGQTWNQMVQAFSGGHYSAVTDLTIDSNGNVWVVIQEDQSSRTNLVVRHTTDLGTTWQTKTQVTNQSIYNGNVQQQIKSVNDKLYIIWLHGLSSPGGHDLIDSVSFSMSFDSGNSWRTPSRVSDTDTIMYGSFYNEFFHPSFDITMDGTIYAVWADCRERYASTVDSSKFNIYISRSTDDGLTWSPNIRVNDSDFVYNRNYYADISVKSNGGIDSVMVTWTKYRNTSTTGILQNEYGLPTQFYLEQNYPNPFNPATTIRFSLPQRTHVTLKVFDLLGREVATLVDEYREAGRYEAEFDAENLPSGMYIYKLQAGNFSQTRKMVLLR